MKDAHLIEQDDCDAAALPFTDFCSKTDQESFDVLPGDVRAGRVGEDCFQGFPMGTLHVSMVPEEGTECNERVF